MESIIEYKINQFINFTLELAHDATVTFFIYKREYPIDEEFILFNSFYSLVLYCVYINKEPTLGFICHVEVDFYDKDKVYQDALALYSRWIENGFDAALYSYCSILNNVITKRALAKAEKSYILVPDFLTKQKEIREKLELISNEKVVQTIDKIKELENI